MMCVMFFEVRAAACPMGRVFWGTRGWEVEAANGRGGEGVVHSRVLASQGFEAAFSPAQRLQRKLTTKGSCPRKRRIAPIGIKTLSGWSGFRKSYCRGFAIRRIIPPAPRKNMGKKTALKNTKVIQK